MNTKQYTIALRLLARFEKAHKAGEPVYLSKEESETADRLPTPYRRMIHRLALGYLPDNLVSIGTLLGQRATPDYRTVLIIGEKSSGSRLPNWPFISLREDGSSKWLAEKLENGGV